MPDGRFNSIADIGRRPVALEKEDGADRGADGIVGAFMGKVNAGNGVGREGTLEELGRVSCRLSVDAERRVLKGNGKGSIEVSICFDDPFKMSKSHRCGARVDTGCVETSAILSRLQV